ncbi:MAG: hypothetical protein KAR20_00515 [Candidatus Heimdallarchaeota archaeon]|nr:hypothetical protein [Candidatus Heimdallarchaeota archaeon]
MTKKEFLRLVEVLSKHKPLKGIAYEENMQLFHELLIQIVSEAFESGLNKGFTKGLKHDAFGFDLLRSDYLKQFKS